MLFIDCKKKKSKKENVLAFHNALPLLIASNYPTISLFVVCIMLFMHFINILNEIEIKSLNHTFYFFDDSTITIPFLFMEYSY